jgi:hypothetical protein
MRETVYSRNTGMLPTKKEEHLVNKHFRAESIKQDLRNKGVQHYSWCHLLFILGRSVDNEHIKLIIQFEVPFVIKILYALLLELAVFTNFLISNFRTTVNVIVFFDNLYK